MRNWQRFATRFEKLGVVAGANPHHFYNSVPSPDPAQKILSLRVAISRELRSLTCYSSIGSRRGS